MAKLALKGGNKLCEDPFHGWPVFDDREKRVLDEVLRSGNWGGFPSPNTKAKEFAERFAAYCGATFGICASNGTVTLETALKAAGLKAGDEVIVPALTWVATAAAAVTVNAVPIFVDIDPDTYCMDPAKIEEAITERTKAIIPVHLGCRMADMDAILEIAKQHELVVIEDCAHAHGARWRDKGAGAIGDLGSFSFQSSKLMTAGEGGIILTSDKGFEERCHSLINCGRKESGYNRFDGEMLGFNYRITEFQAAVLLTQLGRLDEQTNRREENIAYLEGLLGEFEGLTPLARDERLTRTASYQYILRYDASKWNDVHRDLFVQAVGAEGLGCDGYFYIPVYQSSLFRLRADEFPSCTERYGELIDPTQISCPVAELATASEAVWISHEVFLGTKADMDRIAAIFTKVRDNLEELKD